MTLRLVYAAATGQFDAAVADIQKKVATAATGAIRDAVTKGKIEARAAIASAGFSTRWQNAFRANVYPARGVSLSPAGFFYHRIPYAGVFEDGATIAGDPLLWLPLPGVPQSMLGVHMSPANYVRLIGPLHTIFIAGKPPMLAGWILGSARSGVGKITVGKLRAGSATEFNRRGGTGAPLANLISVPLFIGLSSVTIGKKFNLKAVFDRAQAGLGAGYFRNLKNG